jgi:hypothetical protein
MIKIEIEPVLIGDNEYVMVSDPITKGTNCHRCAAFSDAFLCSRLEQVIPGYCGNGSRFWLTLPQYAVERMSGNIVGLK